MAREKCISVTVVFWIHISSRFGESCQKEHVEKEPETLESSAGNSYDYSENE